jgi:hypothetical protein
MRAELVSEPIEIVWDFYRRWYSGLGITVNESARKVQGDCGMKRRHFLEAHSRREP